MIRIKKNYWKTLLLCTIVLVGFSFRIKGIGTNHSFWSDEAYLSGIGKDIFTGRISFIQGLLSIRYQLFQVITVLTSFQIFGLSEWAARIPSVVWGTLGILATFLVTKKLSNYWGGFLAAFLSAFLQINLANSTQAKPYSAIQTLFLFTVFGCSLISEKNKTKNTWLIHLLVLIGSLMAALYHTLGIICLVYYLVHQLPSLLRLSRRLPKIYLYPAVVLIAILFFYSFRINILISLFLRPLVNNATYFRELMWRQYGFLTLPSLFGFLLIRDQKTKISLVASILPVIIMWTFFQESKNIRYLLPLFALIPVGFGIFWTKVAEKLFKNPALVCICVMALLFAGGYKIVRKPAVYYTPNADLFADVQNADYKTFYKLIYEKFPDFDNLPYFTNGFDHGSWYTSHYPSAIFIKINTPPVRHDYYPTMMYPDLSSFVEEQHKYPKGLVVMEDWQSLMPDDIKAYVKENLKLEIRVESMSVSPNDKWPLELYSWGFEEKNK